MKWGRGGGPGGIKILPEGVGRGGARYQNPVIKETRRKSFGNNFFLDG
jgi:hypothetical protein